VNNSLEANICTSIEPLCRKLIYKMHCKRYELLAKNDLIVKWINNQLYNIYICSCGLVQCKANSLLLSSIMLFTVGALRYSRVLQHIKKHRTNPQLDIIQLIISPFHYAVNNSLEANICTSIEPLCRNTMSLYPNCQYNPTLMYLHSSY
jgi:hypothetical protein